MKSAADVNTCKEPARIVRPVINTHKCEGAGECEAVCPFDVFAVRRLTTDERRALPLFPWLNVIAPHVKNAYIQISSDAGETIYNTARAIDARRIVEFGTSFGVSTIYLAAAVRDNGGGKVIGTELEPTKVAVARQNIAAAGLE